MQYIGGYKQDCLYSFLMLNVSSVTLTLWLVLTTKLRDWGRCSQSWHACLGQVHNDVGQSGAIVHTVSHKNIVAIVDIMGHRKLVVGGRKDVDIRQWCEGAETSVPRLEDNLAKEAKPNSIGLV